MCAHAREGGAAVNAEDKAVEGVGASRLVRCSSFSLGAASFRSSCLTMLLEHGTSPLHEVEAHQMWEGLTAALILAGKIPPPEKWGEESGTQGRIEAGLRDLRETFRRREERLLASHRESQENADSQNSPTTQPAASCDP